MDNKSRSYTIVAVLFFVFITVYLSFYPSLCNGYVSWDDGIQLRDNPLVKDFSWGGILKIFTHVHLANYHPLALLSYAIEYRLFGLENAFFYHATSLALHLINSLLVFWFIYLLTDKKIPVALITALLFGVHPMHVESVAWISARREVLYTSFFLGALICYYYYLKKEKNRLYYDLTLVFMVLSCLAKATAVVLPAVLLALDYLLKRKVNARNLLEKIPFFAIGIIFLIITYFARISGWEISDRSFAFIKNVPLVAYTVVFYLGKMLVPVKISSFYPYPGGSDEIFREAIVFSFPVLLLLTAAILFSLRFTRKVLFGVLFFIFTIFFVMNLSPSGMMVAADRYTYVPYIGFFYIAAEGFGWLYARRAAYRAPLVIITACIITTLSVLTWQRCHVWKNGITLWSDVLRKYPNHIACNNLASDYATAGEFDKALLQSNQALMMYPAYPNAYCNRGSVYRAKGDLERAISDYTKALHFSSRESFMEDSYRYANPGSIYINRAYAYYYNKQYDESLEDVRKAKLLGMEIDPIFIRKIGEGLAKKDRSSDSSPKK